MEEDVAETEVELMMVNGQESQVRLKEGKVEIDVVSKEETEEAEPTCWSENTRKVVYGLLLATGISVTWVSATQFSKSTYSPSFNAPFFMIWFSTSWTLSCYPVYLVGSMLLSKEKRRGGWRPLFRESQDVYGPKGLTLRTFFKYIGPFCLCWEVTNYMYIRALGIIAVTDVTALFATNTAFIYVLSWLLLNEKFINIPARSFSVLLSIVGTVLMCYADGFSGGRVEGVLLAMGASLGSALYKVLFFRYIGKATYGQVSLFLTLLGIFNVCLCWPVMLTLYLTKAEVIDWSNLPMNFLCGSSALGLVFNFLVNFGIAVTFPLFITLGNVVGIPMNGVVDWLFRGSTFGALKIVGGVFIIAGFLLMLLPESVQRKAACWREGECFLERQKLDQEAEENEEEEGAEAEVETEAKKATGPKGSPKTAHKDGQYTSLRQENDAETA